VCGWSAMHVCAGRCLMASKQSNLVTWCGICCPHGTCVADVINSPVHGGQLCCYFIAAPA
jgi:hypothetical protein